MSKWIKVKEKLPEPFSWVLVHFKQDKLSGRSLQFVAYMDIAEEWDLRSNPYSGFLVDKEKLIPTHWQPLPENPVDEKEQ